MTRIPMGYRETQGRVIARRGLCIARTIVQIKKNQTDSTSSRLVLQPVVERLNTIIHTF